VNVHFPTSGNNEKKIDSLRRIKLSSEEKHHVSVAERMEEKEKSDRCANQGAKSTELNLSGQIIRRCGI
jgi:hypothetical protein